MTVITYYILMTKKQNKLMKHAMAVSVSAQGVQKDTHGFVILCLHFQIVNVYTWADISIQNLALLRNHQ